MSVRRASKQNTNAAFSLTNPGVGGATPPIITKIVYTDSNYITLDDTAISLTGGYVKIIGNGFASNFSLYLNGAQVTSGNTTYVSSTEVRALLPSSSMGAYSLMLFNANNFGTISPNGIFYSPFPTYGIPIAIAVMNNVPVTQQLGASGDNPLTYSVTSGTLPTGLTLSSSGLLSGTPTGYTASQQINITISVDDAQKQSITQVIAITVQVGDLYWANTSLLLNGDTSSTSFINDASVNSLSLTVIGDARADTFSPYYGDGYYSLYFPAVSRMTTGSAVPSNYGTGDFTFEFWYYVPFFSAATGNYYELSFDNGTWQTGVNSSNWYFEKYGSGWGYFVLTNAVFANQWTHIAVTRQSGTLRGFVNGVLNATAAGKTDNLNGGNFLINQRNSGAVTCPTNAYYSNIRSVVGTALYTASFTVPTSPLTPVSGTALLTAQSNRYLDNSSNNLALSMSAGTAQISTLIPFASNTTYSTYGSAYFDGTGDYLTIASNPVFAIGTGDYTLEFWVYSTIAFSGTTCFYNHNSGGYFLQYAVGTGLQTGVAGSSSTGTYTVTLNSNVWNYIAISRASSSSKCFVNGVQVGTTVSDSTSYAQNGSFIGALYNGSQPLTGYMSDVRIVKGTALYTANFTVPTSPLSAVANTQLLTCQYNGGATNYGVVDSSLINNPLTRAGNASQGTFSPYSQNGWSTYFGTTTVGVQTPSNSLTTIIGTSTLSSSSTFTIEAWVNPLSRHTGGASALGFIAGSMNVSGANADWGFGPDSTGKLTVWWWNGSMIVQATSTNSVPLNTWTHVATSITNGAIKIFINGVMETLSGTTTVTTVSSTLSYLTIGGYTYGSTTWQGFNGYISNLRVSKSALYSANFTVSTSPLVNQSTTSLLTCQSNRFVDNSTNGLTLTLTGAPTVQAFSPFNGSSLISNGSSIAFDGSGDKLTFPSSLAFNLGSTYTIETWIYLNAYPSEWCRFVMISSNGDQAGLCIQVGTTGTIDCGSPSPLGSIVNSNDVVVVPLKTWTHVAVCRDATSARLYINGTLQNTNTTPAIQTAATSVTLTLGYDTQATVAGQLNGFLSNFRIVKGTALYSTNFATSTTPLTNISGTSVLVGHTSQLADGSSNSFAITITGDTKIKTFSPYGYTTSNAMAYSPTSNIGSVYYDGTGDYLTLPATSVSATVAAGDFTWETWIYPTASMPFSVLYGTWNNGSSQWGFGYNHTGSFSLSARLYIYNGNYGSNECARYSTTQLVLNTWTHIAWVRSSNVIYLYVNGVQQTLASYNSGITWSDTFSYTTGQLCGVGGTANYTNTQGYLSNMRYVQGAAIYKGMFIPPEIPVTATTQTVFLLNGTNGGIVDQHSTSVFETIGNTQLASESPYNSNYYSNYFDGSSFIQALSTTAITSLGTQDFTLEGWVNLTATQGTQSAPFYLQGVTGSDVLTLYFNASNNLVGRIRDTASAVLTTLTGTTVLAQGKWHHVAFTRSGSTLTTFINGVQEQTTSVAAHNLTMGTVNLFLGKSPTVNYTGYASNFRLVYGQSLYNSTFTPPVSPLAAVSGTQLLVNQNNKFINNGSSAVTLTTSGSPSVKSINPFQNNPGKSIYFDGTGDYLSTPSSPNLAFGTADFTFECWAYTTVTSSGTICYINGNTSTYAALRVGMQSGQVYLLMSTDGANWGVTSGLVGTAALNSWNYIAITRNSGTVRIFINGVVLGTTYTLSGSLMTGSVNTIGAYGFSPYEYFNGYIKDLRITKGVARYTTTFTPPTTPLLTK